ncbi:NUDIX hydrolase [Oceanobacillus bengalensis]|uniref:NUDIX hydrolase n=1 Tax=Oceanobacillus bengalensis TaxID=1435466 RepID=UPI001FEA20CE|nr:NUDIX domain-containing protein [Oceanobacillus bengalensis]
MNDGYVLLHRDVNDTNWSLPGGRVVTMEDTYQSLKREFQEELHVEITIDKLYWVIENFFRYDEKDFHEIGFYYGITTEDTSFMNKRDFFGMEGNRLIYRWFPIDSLKECELYPVVLRNALQEIPEHTKHLINNELSTIGFSKRNR